DVIANVGIDEGMRGGCDLRRRTRAVTAGQVAEAVLGAVLLTVVGARRTRREPSGVRVRRTAARWSHFPAGVRGKSGEDGRGLEADANGRPAEGTAIVVDNPRWIDIRLRAADDLIDTTETDVYVTRHLEERCEAGRIAGEGVQIRIGEESDNH